MKSVSNRNRASRESPREGFRLRLGSCYCPAEYGREKSRPLRERFRPYRPEVWLARFFLGLRLASAQAVTLPAFSRLRIVSHHASPPLLRIWLVLDKLGQVNQPILCRSNFTFRNTLRKSSSR